MTQEEKAKAYDKVLKKVKDFFEGRTKMYSDVIQTLEFLFPELKESDDEKIRKALIAMVHDRDDLWIDYDIHKEEALAWLEKQGEQILTTKTSFKKGDWVVVSNNHRGIYQIEKIENLQYTLRHILGGSMPLYFCNEDLIRLWTIDDAKDGDVIVCDSKHGRQEIGIVKRYVAKYGMCFVAYCFVDWDGIFRVSEYMGSRNIHPATKEQRDVLFAKMKDEGYEWDAEKKELKRI